MPKEDVEFNRLGAKFEVPIFIEDVFGVSKEEIERRSGKKIIEDAEYKPKRKREWQK